MGNGTAQRQLLVSKIRTDGGTQPRAEIDPLVVDDYADLILAGVAFPPAVVFYDGTDYWPADGFHRRAAYEQAGRTRMPVDVRQGTVRDAILYSVGANAEHGMRRTNEDKRRAVARLLGDPEWGTWTNATIARQCAVSDRFVAEMRKGASPNRSEMRKAIRNGATYTIDVKNIGARQQLAAPVRELIRHTAIADRPDDVRRLAALPEEDQAAAAELLVSGEVKTVAQAKRAIERGERRRDLDLHTASAEPADWRLIRGNAPEEMSKLRAGSARVVWADPRYNLGFDYGPGVDDSTDEEAYLEEMEAWMREAVRLLAPDGSLWVLICREWADDFGVLLKRKLGLHRRGWVTWYETFGENQAGYFNRCGRFLLHYVRDPGNFYFNKAAVMRPSARQMMGDGRSDPGGKIHDDVWVVPRIVGNAAERVPDLPTQVPVEIVRRCVESCSRPGDLVVDPFVGSGTTLAAAAATGRRALGVELVDATASLAERRLRKEQASGFPVTREAFARAEEFTVRYLKALYRADEAAAERKAS